MKKNALFGIVVTALLLFSGCGEEESDTQQSNTGQALFPKTTTISLSTETNGFINEVPEHTEEVYKLPITEAGKYLSPAELK